MLTKLAWRNLWRNKLRTGIVLGAIIFGLIGVTAGLAFMTGFQQNMVENTILWQTSHVQIHNEIYPDDPDVTHSLPNQDAIVEVLESHPDVLHWSNRHIVSGMISSARSARGITVNGVVADKERMITPIADTVTDGEWIDDQGRNPILVSEKTAERLNLRVGSKIVLTFTDVTGDVTGAAFRVRGLFKTPNTGFDDANAYVRQADLQKISKAPTDHEFAIITSSPEAAEALATSLSEQFEAKGIAEPIAVRDWSQVEPMLETMAAMLQIFNYVFLGIFVAAMAFGIVNVLLMSVYERTQEFGVLMAVGMDKRNIRRLIVLESGLMGGVGALVGLGISLATNNWLQANGLDLGSFSDGLSAFGLDSVIYPVIASSDYFITFFTIVVVSLVAGLYPARQILKQNPADAMAEKH